MDQACVLRPATSPPIPPAQVLPFGTYLDGMGQALGRITSALFKVVAARAEQHASPQPAGASAPATHNGTGTGTLLDIMMARVALGKGKSEGKDLFTHRTMVDNLVTAFLAGTDTTGIALAWMLHTLALDAQLQAECAAEALQVDVDAADGAELMAKLPAIRSLYWEVNRVNGPVGKNRRSFHRTAPFSSPHREINRVNGTGGENPTPPGNKNTTTDSPSVYTPSPSPHWRRHHVVVDWVKTSSTQSPPPPLSLPSHSAFLTLAKPPPSPLLAASHPSLNPSPPSHTPLHPLTPTHPHPHPLQVSLLLFEPVEGATVTLQGRTLLPPSQGGRIAISCMVRYANCTDAAGRRAGISNPSQFDPRRWMLPDGSVRNPPMDGYLSFGHGLRVCPGKELSHLEAVVCVAHVLRAFSLALPDGHPKVKSHTKFTQRPDREISLLLTPRADRQGRRTAP